MTSNQRVAQNALSSILNLQFYIIGETITRNAMRFEFNTAQDASKALFQVRLIKDDLRAPVIKDVWQSVNALMVTFGGLDTTVNP